MSVIGAETVWHLSLLGLEPEQPATVNARAATGTAIVTPSRRMCVRICIPSKPATAYRRDVRAPPGSAAAAGNVATSAQIEHTSAPTAQTAAM